MSHILLKMQTTHTHTHT